MKQLKLLPKFMISLIIMGNVLAVSISLFSYFVSKSYFEEMYAYRVVNGSRTIAKMLGPEEVKDVLAAGGEQTGSYQKMYDILNELKKDGGITFLSLVVPHENSVTFYIDTCVESMGDDKANQIPWGTDILYEDAAKDAKDLQKYYQNWELYSQNTGTLEPQVTDNQYGYNYTAAWPVLDESGNAIAQIQYILDMQAVRDHLNSILVTMFGISAGIMLAAILCYIVFVQRNLLAPVGKLVKFTDQITSSGNFHQQAIEMSTGDEIEDLANSFNYMLEELDRYIDNLAKVTSEKERIGAELSVASHIQSSMLPCIFPAFPERKEFDIYASMDPAKEVGGDFYDFFMVDERHVAVVVADVSGKGVPAALFMVIGKTLLKDHTRPGVPPGKVFSDVNNLLCGSNSEGMFITAFEGVLDLVTGEFCYVNAGHEVPYICRKGENFVPYRVRPGFVLAGMEDIRYREGNLQLEPGDRIFLYTDGIPEATDGKNEMYGSSRLEEALNCHREKTPEELLPEIKRDVELFVKDAPQFDDITMLCLEYRQPMEKEPDISEQS